MKKIFLLFCLFSLCSLNGNLYAVSSEQLVTDLLDQVHRPLNGLISSGVMGPEPLAGLPNFTVGVGAAAVKLDYTDINSNSTRSFYAPVPFAAARLGLFGGMVGGLGSVAVGAKYGIISARKDIVQAIKVTGGDIRIGIMDDTIATPGICIDVTYNKVSDIKFGQDTDEAQAVIKGHNTGAKVLVSKDLIILTPYAGVGLDKNTTSASYRITSLGINKSWDKNSTDLHWLLGVELTPLPFFRLGLEYNSIAGDSVYALQIRLKI